MQIDIFFLMINFWAIVCLNPVPKKFWEGVVYLNLKFVNLYSFAYFAERIIAGLSRP